jgi:hypothetical protein
MNGVDWGARLDAAVEAFMEAAQRVPSGSDYGFCAYADAPTAIGGGIPSFCWFQTREQMLATISDHGLFLNPPRSDVDLAATDAVVKKVVAAHRRNLEGLPSALNSHLTNASQFIWMGSFRELCESDHPQAKKVRAEFRGHKGIAGDPGTTKSDELASFVEFIGRYGVS